MHTLFFKKVLIILRQSTEHANFLLGVQFPLKLPHAYVYFAQIYQGDPSSHILPRVMAMAAMGANWGSLGFCRPYTKRNTIFAHHAQTTEDAGDIRT